MVNLTQEAEKHKKGVSQSSNDSSVIHSKTVQMKNHTADDKHHKAHPTKKPHVEQHGKFEAPGHNVTQHHAAPLSQEQKKSTIIHIVLATLFVIVFLFCCCTFCCKKK